MNYVWTGVGLALGYAIGAALFGDGFSQWATATYYSVFGLLIHWLQHGRKEAA